MKYSLPMQKSEPNSSARLVGQYNPAGRSLIIALVLCISSIVFQLPFYAKAFAQDTLTYEETHTFINQLPKLSPGFISVGRYQPNEMQDDMYGIWIEYSAANTYYLRARAITRLEIGRTASGDCRLVLSGDHPSIGYRWVQDRGWQRDRGTIFMRSSNCQLIQTVGEAYARLIEFDGGRVNVTNSLSGAF